VTQYFLFLGTIYALSQPILHSWTIQEIRSQHPHNHSRKDEQIIRKRQR
jgi:hypothetical protein